MTDNSKLPPFIVDARISAKRTSEADAAAYLACIRAAESYVHCSDAFDNVGRMAARDCFIKARNEAMDGGAGRDLLNRLAKAERVAETVAGLVEALDLIAETTDGHASGIARAALAHHKERAK